ncbi:MAG: amidohydrolase family protein [Candidatus Latescibacterota bacterium]|jgi:imidazolonepropionase-like amidohydrolase
MNKLITADHLFDGVDGNICKDQAIHIANGRIVAIDHKQALQKELPPDTEMIDLGNICLAPGLIDSHTHVTLPGDSHTYEEMFSETDEMMALTGVMNLQIHLKAGITSVREHGARNKLGFVLKEGVKRGYFPSPRMLVSGRPITCTGGHFHFCNEVADGPDEIRRSVRRLVHEGADYIKIMASGGGTLGTLPGRASYTTEELHAAVHEAHHFHKLTAAHCRAKESMVRAIDAGIDLMEHAEFLDPDDIIRFDPDLAKKMAESQIWISPTLQAWTRYYRIVHLRSLRETSTLSPSEEAELAHLETRMASRLDIMRQMLDFGMKDRIVPGTDSGVQNFAFGHLDYDLQILTQIGFTPAEALISATKTSAEAIGLADQMGTLEVGKVADIVALDGDPTKDIGACSRVKAVFLEGNRVG